MVPTQKKVLSVSVRVTILSFFMVRSPVLTLGIAVRVRPVLTGASASERISDTCVFLQGWPEVFRYEPLDLGRGDEQLLAQFGTCDYALITPASGSPDADAQHGGGVSDGNKYRLNDLVILHGAISGIDVRYCG
jgi:hypothetical protein